MTQDRELSAMTTAARRSRIRSANDAWESLLTAHAALLRLMRSTGTWREVSIREYDVLYTLSKCAAPVRQSELSQHVLLSQPAISRLVERLVERRMVRRAADPADGRGVLLALTEEGSAIQRRIGARHALDVAQIVASRLSADEMEELHRLTRKLAGIDDPNAHDEAVTIRHDDSREVSDERPR